MGTDDHFYRFVERHGFIYAEVESFADNDEDDDEDEFEPKDLLEIFV